MLAKHITHVLQNPVLIIGPPAGTNPIQQGSAPHAEPDMPTHFVHSDGHIVHLNHCKGGMGPKSGGHHTEPLLKHLLTTFCACHQGRMDHPAQF